MTKSADPFSRSMDDLTKLSQLAGPHGTPQQVAGTTHALMLQLEAFVNKLDERITALEKNAARDK